MVRPLFAFLLLSFSWACKGPQDASSSNEIITEALPGTWYKLPADASGDIIQFTTDQTSLPPSRFQERIIFESDDQRVIRYTPGPDDRPKATHGSWRWITADLLIVSFDEAEDTLSVLSLNKNYLQFKTP